MRLSRVQMRLPAADVRFCHMFAARESTFHSSSKSRPVSGCLRGADMCLRSQTRAWMLRSSRLSASLSSSSSHLPRMASYPFRARPSLCLLYSPPLILASADAHGPHSWPASPAQLPSSLCWGRPAYAEPCICLQATMWHAETHRSCAADVHILWLANVAAEQQRIPLLLSCRRASSSLCRTSGGRWWTRCPSRPLALLNTYAAHVAPARLSVLRYCLARWACRLSLPGTTLPQNAPPMRSAMPVVATGLVVGTCGQLPCTPQRARLLPEAGISLSPQTSLAWTWLPSHWILRSWA